MLKVPGLQAEHGVALGQAVGLKTGQSVTAVGYTGGLGIQSSSGSVIGLHRYEGAPVIQSDNWFSSGASGGALFDDQLRLVGVLTFRLRGGSAHYFAAPAEWLRPMLDGSVPFQVVAPGDARTLAYWQKPAEQQPLFLRAAALERDLRWSELATLSTRWSQDDAADAAPWSALALALENLGRLPDAQRALQRSLAIEPEDGTGWLRMGRLHVRLGEVDKAHEVQVRLLRLAPELAAELARELPVRATGS
jgi:tetratricopeptide (TPR) repeat protein